MGAEPRSVTGERCAAADGLIYRRPPGNRRSFAGLNAAAATPFGPLCLWVAILFSTYYIAGTAGDLLVVVPPPEPVKKIKRAT